MDSQNFTRRENQAIVNTDSFSYKQRLLYIQKRDSQEKKIQDLESQLNELRQIVINSNK